MTNADDMLAFAASQAEQLAAPGLSPRPRRKVAVLACMDTRIDLFPMLGLSRGDAHIIRNAGGLVTDDAIRSLSVSQRKLGTEEVVVVMHDGCGLHEASEDEFARALANDGVLPSWRLGAFDDVEATLRSSLISCAPAPSCQPVTTYGVLYSIPRRARCARWRRLFNPTSGRPAGLAPHSGRSSWGGAAPRLDVCPPPSPALTQSA